ncbi:MAG: aldo/keto reductase, partial [Limosilactobacillus fermentum]
FPADDIRSTMADFREPRVGKIRGALAVVRTIAASHGATVSQVVLAWYMQNPLITAVIPGAKQPDQVIQNAAALQLELTLSEYQTIEEAFAGFK